MPPREHDSRGGSRSFSSADLVAGLVLAGIGLVFGVVAFGYDMGTPLAMGPGQFPLIVSIVLVAIGAAIVVRAFVAPSQEPEPEASIDVVEYLETAIEQGPEVLEERPMRPVVFGAIPWRPLLLVTAAVIWFAVTIDGLGMLLAAFGTVVLASWARSGVRWWQPLVVGAVLTLASWLIFVVGLQLRVPLVGDWLGG